MWPRSMKVKSDGLFSGIRSSKRQVSVALYVEQAGPILGEGRMYDSRRVKGLAVWKVARSIMSD